MAPVLVVEDAGDLARLLGRELEQVGHRALIAGDGPSALAVHAAVAPGLVVLDGMSPGFDGLEVLRRIHARASTRVLMPTARVKKSTGCSVLRSAPTTTSPNRPRCEG